MSFNGDTCNNWQCFMVALLYVQYPPFLVYTKYTHPVTMTMANNVQYPPFLVYTKYTHPVTMTMANNVQYPLL